MQQQVEAAARLLHMLLRDSYPAVHVWLNTKPQNRKQFEKVAGKHKKGEYSSTLSLFLTEIEIAR